jgi:hypothetical protein
MQPHRGKQSWSGDRWSRRYGLRTLFIFSLAVAFPFVVFANLQGTYHPEYVLTSPVYLVVCVIGVLSFAAMGDTLGGNLGTVAGAILAGAIWLAVIWIANQGSNSAVLLSHIIAISIVTIGIAAQVLSHKETPRDDPSVTIRRLIEIKNSTRAEQTADNARRQCSSAPNRLEHTAAHHDLVD